jgi:hypothetical protein
MLSCPFYQGLESEIYLDMCQKMPKKKRGKLYLHTISVELAKIEVKYHSNFCYFHINGVEITHWGVEITSPKKKKS